ncbi:unnamed protein product, partial [Phaeothamnion confervicola]
ANPSGGKRGGGAGRRAAWRGREEAANDSRRQARAATAKRGSKGGSKAAPAAASTTIRAFAAAAITSRGRHLLEHLQVLRLASHACHWLENGKHRHKLLSLHYTVGSKCADAFTIEPCGSGERRWRKTWKEKRAKYPAFGRKRDVSASSHPAPILFRS